MTRVPLRCGALVAAASLAYFAVLLLLGPIAGTPVMGLLLVPAAVAGWCFGVVGGSLAALALVAANAAMASVVAPDGFAVSAGAIPADLMTLAGGVALGAIREWQREATSSRHQALEKLEETEALAAALGASEQRFRLLAEEALVGVYLIQDGLFQYLNRAFADTFGYATTDILGILGPEDLTVPDDWPLVRGHLENRLARGAGPAHYRFRGLRRDGTPVRVEVLGRALDIDGRPAVLGTLLDLTRQTEDEAALRLRMTALEAAPAGIVITDPEAVIQWANPHALGLSGYELDDVLGQSTRLFSSGHQDQAFYQELWRTVSAGRVWQGELVNRRKDGSEYLEAMSITPVVDDDGTVLHYVAVKQDVTQQRAHEASIRDLNESLALQLERILTLRAIDAAITDGRPVAEGIVAYAEAAVRGLKVDAICVFLTNDQADELQLAHARGFRSAPEGFRLELGQGVAGQAAQQREPFVVQGPDEILASVPPRVRSVLANEAFETLVAVPMAVRGSLRGVLVAGHRRHLAPDEGWLEFFRAVATQGGILVDNATLLDHLKARNAELQAAYDATIEGWSRALDLRDRETEGHSRRVTELTLRLARAMGMSDEELVHLRRGSLLHDIGKMGIPDAILQKPGALTEQEWTTMKRHTEFARELLAPIEFLGPALEIPDAHHERWDGSGYPEGRAGRDIPEAARIFAVADVYDALTSDRPYRPAWTHEQAVAHIVAGSGTHFDPEVVEVFVRLAGERQGTDAGTGDAGS